MQWKRTESPRDPSPYTEFMRSDTAFSERMRALSKSGVPFRFRTRGFSMSPFIKNDDVVKVMPVRGAGPRLGDVILCTHPRDNSVLVHRIIGRVHRGYVVKGDNCVASDGTVHGSDVLGLVTGVERDEAARTLGLGPERVLIAMLSRSNLFLSVVVPLWNRVRTLPARRRS